MTFCDGCRRALVPFLSFDFGDGHLVHQSSGNGKRKTHISVRSLQPVPTPLCPAAGHNHKQEENVSIRSIDQLSNVIGIGGGSSAGNKGSGLAGSTAARAGLRAGEGQKSATARPFGTHGTPTTRVRPGCVPSGNGAPLLLVSSLPRNGFNE